MPDFTVARRPAGEGGVPVSRRRRTAAEMRLTEEQRRLAAEWYPILRPRLVPVAMAVGLDRDEAESVVDYAIVSAAGGWPGRGRFDTFADRVVRRHALNARAQRPRALATIDPMADAIPAPADDDTPPPPLLAALDAIPAADLELLRARFADGDPVSAIGRARGWYQSLAESRIQAALKRARALAG
jgi:DNA-directed RNA polymerase specialized sigma24 family protein